MFRNMLIILLLAASPSWAATYYIDASTMDDAGSGLSKTDPWKRTPDMIGFNGVYTYSSGDLFVLKGGEVWGSVNLPVAIANSNTGYITDPAWFTGSTFARPVLDLEGLKPSAIWVAGKANLVFDNLHLINPSEQVVYNPMVMIRNADYVTFKNSIIDGSAGNVDATPFNLRDTDNVSLLNNIIKGGGFNGNSDGILVRPWWRITNLTIAGNTISNELGDGIHIDAENTTIYNALYPFGSMTYYGPILIENNTFTNFPEGGKFGLIIIGGAKDLTIRQNRFTGEFESGSSLRLGQVGRHYESVAGPELYWFENIEIYNNLFYGIFADSFSGWGIISLHGTNASGLNTNTGIYNNTLLADGTYPAGEIGLSATGGDNSTWVVKNNIIKGFAQATQGGAGLIQDTNLYHGNNVTVDTGINAIFSDPLLQVDLSLSELSPAIDAGLNISSIFINDFDGTLRDPAWDIGAFEYTQPQCIITPN